MTRYSSVYFVRSALLASGCFLAGRLGLLFSLAETPTSLFWPAAGLALGGMLLWGRSLWPAILAGAFFASLSTWGLSAALVVAVASTAEALLGTWLLRRQAGWNNTLENVQNVGALTLKGAFLAPLPVAALGTLGLALVGAIPWPRYWPTATTWWSGDCIGILAVTPALLAWFAPRVARPAKASPLEGVGLTACFLTGMALVFSPLSGLLGNHVPNGVLGFPAIIWAGIRFGAPGTALAVLGTTLAGALGTWLGHGPFVRADHTEVVAYLWLYLTGGAVTGLVLSATVSERIRAEQALRESRQRLALAIRGANDGLYDMDLESGLVYYSPRFLELLGFAGHEDELERTAAEFERRFHPQDRAVLMRLRACQHNGTPFDGEFRLRGRDNSYQWYHSRARRQTDGADEESGPDATTAGERHAHFAGFITNVTRRRRAQERAARAQDLLESIRRAQSRLLVEENIAVFCDAVLADFLSLAASEYGFLGEVLRDSDGKPYMRTLAITNIAWNEPTRALYEEMAPQGMEFHNLRTLFGAVLVTRQPVIANDAPRDARGGGLPPGHPELRSFLGLPILYGERLVGMVGIANRPKGYDFDLISELEPLVNTCAHVLVSHANQRDRRRAEEERRALELKLLQTQKLESLGILAGGIAHDFNNLLTGILGYADLALADMPTKRAPELEPVRDSIEQIAASARRAAELTRQMLDYSGKGRLLVQPVDLAALVREMSQLLDVTITKRCCLRHDLAENLPTIEADATQIRQVIMNLILNAAEAIGDSGGLITLSARPVQLDRAQLEGCFLDDGLAPGRYVLLEVADTGCGMTDEVRRRIFDPFFTTKFTGRGLGLAAVLGIIRGHRGSIKVDSQAGLGTTFQVYFPASDRAAPLAASPVAPAADLAGGLVLVVDDEPTVRDLAKRMLERIGMRCLVAADGLEAIEIYSRRPEEISLVLLDLTMPHLGGEEVFARIRRIRPDARVVLTTGFDEQDTLERRSLAGLAGFLQKPFRLHDLQSALCAALSSPRAPTPRPSSAPAAD